VLFLPNQKNPNTMKTLLLFGAIALALSSFGQVPTYVPASNLVAWYEFSGNANDETGNGNNGTVLGATLTTDRFGSPNSAYSFDGIDDIIQINTIDNLTFEGDFSISLWCSFSDFINDYSHLIYGENEYIVFNGNGPTYGLDASRVSAYQGPLLNAPLRRIPYFQSGSQLIQGTDYHLTLIKDGNSAYLYVNGILETITPVNNLLSVPLGSYLQIGSGYTNTSNYCFHGDIDDVGIWDRALSECEIQELYSSQLLNTTGTDIQNACNTFDWIDGNTYTATNNTATWTETNAAGCDSIVTLNLTMTNSNTGTDTQTACDSYTWIDGNTYTAPNNTATWTETNAAGCDSVVTLDLTITNSNTGTDVQTACNTFDWIDGNTYTSDNNSATWTETNAAGCDSVVTLDLTITPLPDNNVTQAGSLLTADQTGATYQWLDCDDNNAQINGETNQSYTPTVTGNYAVEVTLNGCVDTSACFLVDYTGLSDLYAEIISIHPNPTSDVLTISGLNEVNGLRSMEITSTTGKLVMKIEELKEEIDVSKLPTGVYFLNIVHEKGVETIRFVKQ